MIGRWLDWLGSFRRSSASPLRRVGGGIDESPPDLLECQPRARKLAGIELDPNGGPLPLA